MNQIRKFARKTREYKLTDAFIFCLADEINDATTDKYKIEHKTRMFKVH